MSVIEIAVIGFGAAMGYWLVTRLLPQSPGADPHVQHSAPTADAEPPENCWQILKLSPEASLEEIQHAYKTLISQYHPDKVACLGEELRALAEKKSQEITEAYRQAIEDKNPAP